MPIFVKALENLSHVLKKGEEWADENKVDHSKLLEGKLAPDMKPLTYQIQSLSNSSKFVLSRVAGLDVPTWEDNETTFEQLQQRLKKTIDLLKSADKSAFEGKEQSPVVFKLGPSEVKLTGLTYLQFFAVPNIFFHVVTAYDILRNAGVPVGKRDYLAGGASSLT